MTSTNFSKTAQTSTGYGYKNVASGVLLIETSDELLLENGTDSLLLENLETGSTNYTKTSTPSTNFS